MGHAAPTADWIIRAQVQSYLRFAKLKRDQHVRETLSVIHGFQADRIQRGVSAF
jgi:hypothetical protein